jgi:hypothetical protein
MSDAALLVLVLNRRARARCGSRGADRLAAQARPRLYVDLGAPGQTVPNAANV